MTKSPDLLHRVRAHAARAPETMAVQDGTRSLTYRALSSAVAALGARLRVDGVQAGDTVALNLGPSCEAIVSLLATWHAGAAFLFVDPDERPDHTRRLLDDAGVRHVVGPTLAGRPGIGVTQSGEAAPAPFDPDSLAYVVATSGSSGRAKAVRVAHRGIGPLLEAQVAAFALDREARVLLGTPLRFDASLSDIGTALWAGATLMIPPDRTDPVALRTFMEDERITHADLPPAMLALLETPPRGLRTAIVGGELVAAEILRRWAERTRLVVCYGPTEATVCASLTVVDTHRFHPASIGRPLPHVPVRVVGDDGVEAQGEGELWLGGPAVALGYAGHAEIERARFVTEGGARWYRTGDRVRREADGELTFLGRLDRECKLRGRRVRPEEVEAHARAISGVRAAAVVYRPVRRAGLPPRPTLVCFAELEAGTSPQQIAASLAERLPAAWTTRLEPLERLPRTPTGKPDLHALAALPLPGEEASAPPSASPARALADVLQRVLALPAVDLDDDFVALGGDSLAALEVVREAERAGLFLAADAVLAARTPRAMAAHAGHAVIPVAQIEEALAAYRRLAVDVGPARRACREPVVLFTGATGFFGARLVAAWLDAGPGTAVCLVRAADDTQARAQLLEAWAAQRLPPPDPERVQIVRGDCAAPRLGLTAPEHTELAARLDGIAHAAARTAVTAPLSALLPTNVGGARATGELARAAGCPLHHVSSLAVLLAGEGAPAVIDEQVSIEVMRTLFGGYAASKWAAERVLAANVRTLHVHRLGLLGADSRTGAGARDGSLAACIRGLAGVGCLPDEDLRPLRFDLTPVDLAARAVASLMRGSHEPGVWHHSSERGAALELLAGALRHEGVRLDRVTRARFVAAARAPRDLDAARAAMALATLLDAPCMRPDLDLFLLRDRTLRSEHTKRASGVTIPEPTLDTLRAEVRAALDGARPCAAE